jgi:hypothetical protein
MINTIVYVIYSLCYYYIVWFLNLEASYANQNMGRI